MAYYRLENGKAPTIDVGDETEGRRELEAFVDAAGLQNVIIALARFTSDRHEALIESDLVLAKCWSESAKALFRCAAQIERVWPPSDEFKASVLRSQNAERVGSALAQTVKKLFR